MPANPHTTIHSCGKAVAWPSTFLPECKGPGFVLHGLGLAVGSWGKVKGEDAGSLIGLLPRGPRLVALLLHGLVPCGIHGHLPGCEGP